MDFKEKKVATLRSETTDLHNPFQSCLAATKKKRIHLPPQKAFSELQNQSFQNTLDTLQKDAENLKNTEDCLVNVKNDVYL